MPVTCPVCGGAATVATHLDAARLRRELSTYFATELPDSATVGSYDLARCPACTLEFAHPMAPGDGGFYDWVTRQAEYYAVERWEWDRVLERLRGRASTDVLEVGCGAGRFLSRLAAVPGVKAVGVDTTPASVDACRAQGLTAYCEMLDAFAQRPEAAARFDVVCSFHCLEHVPDPKGLVVQMLSLLRPGGALYLSTPFSPEACETVFFDPLNHPPHHLTRWNAVAFERLAREVGATLRLDQPPPSGLLQRTGSALNLLWNGRRTPRSRPAVVLQMATRPLQTLAELRRQRSRPRVNGEAAADIVLAELRPST